MYKHPFVLAVALALPVLAMTSASDAQAMPAHETPVVVGQEVVVVVAPPVEVVERVSVAPSPRHFWIRGYHRWTGAGHVWIPGRWELRREGFRYADAYWERSSRGWRFHEGIWLHL